MKKTRLVSQSDATGASHGSRGSQHFPPGSDPSDNLDYMFNDSAGEGTDVYILDTGIFTSHDDFGGRADLLKSFIRGEDNTTDLDGRTYFRILLYPPQTKFHRVSHPSFPLMPSYANEPHYFQTVPTALVQLVVPISASPSAHSSTASKSSTNKAPALIVLSSPV